MKYSSTEVIHTSKAKRFFVRFQCVTLEAVNKSLQCVD